MSSNKNIKKKPSSVSLICELSRLKCQEIYLQNIQTISLKFQPTDEEMEEKKIFAEIEKLQLHLTQDFKNRKQIAKNSIDAISDEISEFKEMSSNIQNYDLKQYRERILNIEENIVNISNMNKLNLGKLKFEYLDLSSIIPSPAELLQDDRKPFIFIKNNSRLNLPEKQMEESLYNEVKLFDKFLISNGGHNGGWNDEGHLIYLRNKSKYQSNLECIQENILKVLPHLSLEEIEAHDKWFEEYTTLKTNRKIAIERWKNSK